ncbi:hypothetical protein GCM10027020_33220 [Nocardioides salsibiostraticola]
MTRERELPQDVWRARLAENAWLLAFDDDTAVGLACGIHTATPGELELTAMWIAPSHRGTGLGDALIGAVRDWAADQGAHRLTLAVVSTNDSAIRLYARHGFTVAESALPSDHGQRENDIVMSLDLSSGNPDQRPAGLVTR